MEAVLILVVAGMTSGAAYVLGRAGLGYSGSWLWRALGKLCECVGLTMVFSGVNLAVAMAAILAIRSLSGYFISLYMASDLTFLLLSWFQALIFLAWREGSQRHQIAASHDRDLLPRQP